METQEKPAEMPAASDAPTPIDGLILEGGEFGDAMAFSSVKMPPKRNGLPCHYLYKESIVPGTFKDANGKEWTITTNDVADMKSDLDRAMLLGHEPTIQDSHRNPTKSFGFIKGSRINERGGLELLHQFMGDAERDEALRRKTSIMLLPKYEDARGNKFNWYTDHSAIVFRPQLTNLKDYQPLAASGQPVNASYLTLSTGETSMDITSIRQALGTAAADKSDTEVLALAAASISAQPKLPAELSISALRTSLGENAKDATDAQIPTLALSAYAEANDFLLTRVKEIETERDQAKQQVLALEANTETEPAEIDPRLAAMLADNVGTARELALSAGITPAQMKLFDDILNGSDGKPSALALSAGAQSSHPIAFQVYKALQLMGDGLIKHQNGTVRGVPAKPGVRPEGDALALAGKDPVEKPNRDEVNKARADAGLPPLAA
jgi:hypothetical protein